MPAGSLEAVYVCCHFTRKNDALPKVMRAAPHRPACNVLLSTLILSALSLLFVAMWTALEAYRVNSLLSVPLNGQPGARGYFGDTADAVIVAIVPVFYSLALLNVALMFVEILALIPSEMSHNLSWRSRQVLLLLEVVVVACAVVYAVKDSAVMAIIVSFSLLLIISLIFALATFKFSRLAASAISSQFVKLSLALSLLSCVLWVLLLVWWLYATSPLPPSWSVLRVAQWTQISVQYFLVLAMGLILGVDHRAIHARQGRQVSKQGGSSNNNSSAERPAPSVTPTPILIEVV